MAAFQGSGGVGKGEQRLAAWDTMECLLPLSLPTTGPGLPTWPEGQQGEEMVADKTHFGELRQEVMFLPQFACDSSLFYKHLTLSVKAVLLSVSPEVRDRGLGVAGGVLGGKAQGSLTLQCVGSAGARPVMAPWSSWAKRRAALRPRQGQVNPVRPE